MRPSEPSAGYQHGIGRYYPSVVEARAQLAHGRHCNVQSAPSCSGIGFYANPRLTFSSVASHFHERARMLTLAVPHVAKNDARAGLSKFGFLSVPS